MLFEIEANLVVDYEVKISEGLILEFDFDNSYVATEPFGELTKKGQLTSRLSEFVYAHSLQEAEELFRALIPKKLEEPILKIQDNRLFSEVSIGEWRLDILSVDKVP